MEDRGGALSTPRYPALFQITQVRLSVLVAARERKAKLDDIPDGPLDALVADEFDLLWRLGVWQTGEAARGVSQSNREWLEEYAAICRTSARRTFAVPALLFRTTASTWTLADPRRSRG